MSDDDLLSRATGALRDESGQRESTRAAVGRVRVLTALRARNARRRRLGGASVAACVTLLCAGAWAAATGRVPLGRLFREGASVSAPAQQPPAHGARALPPSARPAPSPVATAPSASAPSASAAPAAPSHSTGIITEDSVLPAAAPRTRAPHVVVIAAARAGHVPVAARGAAAPAPSATASPPLGGPVASAPEVPLAPVAVEDPAEALYRAAHLAHFATRDPQTALAAWERYLAAAPDGRFAPEARYNRALTLVRLGRMTEARDALAPFADAAEGSYRQREAAALRARLVSATGANSAPAPTAPTSPSAR